MCKMPLGCPNRGVPGSRGARPGLRAAQLPCSAVPYRVELADAVLRQQAQQVEPQQLVHVRRLDERFPKVKVVDFELRDVPLERLHVAALDAPLRAELQRFACAASQQKGGGPGRAGRLWVRRARTSMERAGGKRRRKARRGSRAQRTCDQELLFARPFRRRQERVLCEGNLARAVGRGAPATMVGARHVRNTRRQPG